MVRRPPLFLAFLMACASSTPAPPASGPAAADDEIKIADGPTRTSSAPAAPAPTIVVPPPPSDLGTPGKTGAMLIDGFLGPAAAIYDEGDDLYLVSNVNGDPLIEDGNGFISQVSPEGNVVNLRFIDGGKPGVNLSAPKGMVTFGNILAVADLHAVRIFELKTGKPVRSIEIDGATALSDVAVTGDGSLVVSDAGFKLEKGKPVPSGTDALYRVDREGGYAPIVKSPRLARPRGLFINGDSIDVSTGGAAALLRYGFDGRERGIRTAPTGSLEGLVSLPGGIRAFSSRDGRCVYTVNTSFQFMPMIGGLDGPGDLGVDARRRRLLIPLSAPGKLMIVPY